ncbi:MAG: FAD-dependent thymidylate synthase, partial [Patescibacteria group bacterium]
RVDTKFLEELTHAEKIMRFMNRWRDAYGHNSIARMGAVWICFEQVSALAAKSIEWGRPGAGYIELSTRYVDMSKRGYYPIHKELAAYGVDEKKVQDVMDGAFSFYAELEGEKFTGPFPQFLREQYGALFAGNEKDLESGVIGETCDVLGNFLPSGTQTSVGVNVSGEGLQDLIKHLILDNTPENIALVDEIIVEAKKTGVDQFIRHTEATPWKEESWKYLSVEPFRGDETALVMDSPAIAEETIFRSFSRKIGYESYTTFDDVVDALLTTPRGEYDKLPNEFECANATFAGKITFRGWRDVQRQGFCTHLRTYVTPLLGFYRYDKQAPTALTEAFEKIHAANLALYVEMKEKGVPDELMQYPLSLGNMIGFSLSANMLEVEFCNWQRSKFSVNHEVRQIFLAMEQHMRKMYPWWKKLSRANTTPAYVFARGSKGIPLE